MKSTIALTILALNATAVLAVDYSAVICKDKSQYKKDHTENDNDGSCDHLAGKSFHGKPTPNCTNSKQFIDLAATRYACCGEPKEEKQSACYVPPPDFSGHVCKDKSKYKGEQSVMDGKFTCDSFVKYAIPNTMPNCSETVKSPSFSHYTMKGVIDVMSTSGCCGTGKSACDALPNAGHFTHASLLATILVVVTSMMMC